jgi:hypothetical protein
MQIIFSILGYVTLGKIIIMSGLSSHTFSFSSLLIMSYVPCSTITSRHVDTSYKKNNAQIRYNQEHHWCGLWSGIEHLIPIYSTWAEMKGRHNILNNEWKKLGLCTNTTFPISSVAHIYLGRTWCCVEEVQQKSME